VGTTIIVDACTIITFGNVGRLDVVDGLRAHRVVTGIRSRDEVRRDPAKQQVLDSISAGRIIVEQIDLTSSAEQDSLRDFDARPAFRNRGDAEVLALAERRGYVVASDDGAVSRIVRDRFGQDRLAGALDLLVWAVRENRIELQDAKALLATLDLGPQVLLRLQKAGKALDDLL